MSCDCGTKVYAGPTSRDSNVLQMVPPTGSANDGKMGSGGMHHFCWKCFAFWGLVALVVLWAISDGGGE